MDVNLCMFYVAITEQEIKITMIILRGDIKQKRDEEAVIKGKENQSEINLLL